MVAPERVIGVRTPVMRRFARTFAKQPEAEIFLKSLPHQYYDENQLHGLLISQMQDYGQVIAALNQFLPYIDNWATCDIISPKVFQKNLPVLLGEIKDWLTSHHPYTVRFGVKMLMDFYLDEGFQKEYLTWVAQVKHEDYYVKMAVAWYFATALAKQYDATLPYLQQNRLSRWIHNKTIQKAVESYRITGEQKEYLRSLRIAAER